MWEILANLLGGPIVTGLIKAYQAKLTSENTAEKIAADLAGRELAVEQRERELAVQQNIADEGRWWTAARAARGSGAAKALIDDAEARLAANGVTVAWLACAIGNARAARFFQKHGWVNARTVADQLDAGDAVYEVEVWRFEKAVRR